MKKWLLLTSLVVLWLGTGCGWAGETAVITPVAPLSPTMTAVLVPAVVSPTPVVLPTETAVTPQVILLPSPTPQPTPTPILYTVQAGDTILGIALQWGTTVEQILALNPGVKPELLQIGQQLVLPPLDTAVLAAAGNEPVSLAVAVQNVRVVRTPLESVWLLGEVANLGERPLVNVRVQADWRNGAGDVVATAVSWTEPAVIPVGMAAPFAVLLSDAPPETAEPVITVVGGDLLAGTEADSTWLLGLRARETAVTQAEGRTVVTGVLANEDAETAIQSTLVATLYDETGGVSGYAVLVLEEPLAPGEERPFRLETAPPGNRPVTATVLAIAHKQTQSGE